MSYKVFLVEDEIVIKTGIKNSIPWELEGYQFVGEASDGELAYPMIIREKPDILITDIKMPFMDGLELSKLVKQELPDIKILILSGYDEFEYAKEAIRIGVTDYLLKPISAQKLLKVLRDVSEIIAQEREEKDLLKRYMEDMKENMEHEKQTFFHSMIRGEVSFSEAIRVGKEYGMNLSAQFYNILLFKVFSRLDEIPVTDQIWRTCGCIENEVGAIPYVYLFQRGVDGWAFMIVADDMEQMQKRQERLINRLTGIMNTEKELEYFGGMGKAVDRIRNLGNSFREAEKAFAERFTRKSNQIICEKDMISNYKDEEFTMKGFLEIGKSREMIGKFLNNGTKEELDKFAETYIMRVECDNLKSMLMRQYIVMDIYIVIMSFCEKLEISDEKFQKEVEHLKSAMQTVNSKEELKRYVVSLLKQAIELRDSISGKRYSDIIISAQEIIEKNYMTEEISLQSVAVSVGMSPSYFSMIFSKEVGKTFVEYLTETRMEKAKELLMCSAMKTSEVGYEVGYKDAHYFSYIFKKTQGCSPKEYRMRGKEV